MRLLKRLAIRTIQELASNPKARAKIAQGLKTQSRKLNEDIKPRAKRAWQDAQPKIKSAKRGIKSLIEDLRDEYRKGRIG